MMDILVNHRYITIKNRLCRVKKYKVIHARKNNLIREKELVEGEIARLQMELEKINQLLAQYK